MTNLNDSLDNLFDGDTGPVRTAPVRADAVQYTDAVQRFEENCPKCRGTGKFVGYTGRVFGNCFTCKGAGKRAFKTSPETRAANREQAANRRDRAEEQNLADFAAAHPEIAAWIEAKHLRFNIAADMRASVLRFGSLTEGRLAAAQRFMDQDASRAQQAAERRETAPQVDTAGIDRLKEAFDKARAYAAAKAPGLSIRNPKITIGGMTISPAKADSRNAGALYVKQAGEYLGKIMNGKFMAVQACTEDQRKQVLAFVANPAEAAKVYGQETGICCVCNATLKSKWRLRGIGPVCAEKMGWAGLAEDFGAL